MKNDIQVADYDGSFAIALDLLENEEKSQVVRYLVDQIRTIGNVLEILIPKSGDSERA